jgi:replication-associated recombination protein RarA
MLLTLEQGGDIAALVRSARAETVDSIVVSIAPTLNTLAMAQARAAIGPLAIELAPACRVNAVCPAIDAARTDVEAAIAFLEHARSTTGQIIEIASN